MVHPLSYARVTEERFEPGVAAAVPPSIFMYSECTRVRLPTDLARM